MVRWSDIAGAGDDAPALRDVRASALSQLCSLAARLYSYPSVSWLQAFLSPACLAECRDLLADAFVADDTLDQALCNLQQAVDRETAAGACRSGGNGVAADGEATGVEQLARSFRIAFTKKHLVPPVQASLEGSWWMRRHAEGVVVEGVAGDSHARMNPRERAAVLREYRALGLRVRSGVGYPPDHVANELDFLAYVLGMQADALDAFDAASAAEWGEIASRFARTHLLQPACGITLRVLGSARDMAKGSAVDVASIAARGFAGDGVAAGIGADPVLAFAAALLAALSQAATQTPTASFDDW